MSDTSNTSAGPQVLVPQALLEETQRQLQALQAAVALHATPPATSVRPPASPSNPASQLTHLKPARPARYSGVKDYTTIEDWIASVNRYFVLTGAKPRYVYH